MQTAGWLRWYPRRSPLAQDVGCTDRCETDSRRLLRETASPRAFGPFRALAARGESPPAFGAPSAAAALGTPFGRRCIPADCVAPPLNIPDIAPHRAQDARWGPRSAVVAPLSRGPHGADCAPWGGTSGRLAALGATADFHHGLLADCVGLTYRPLKDERSVRLQGG